MKIEEHLLRSLFVMAEMVEARDPYTGGHLWRVSQYSLMFAREEGVGTAAASRIALGGFLHDLGKIGIPDAILNKPDKLSDEEYRIVKTHPRIGLRVLGDHLLAGMVRDAVLLHHERPDGSGYPEGRTNEHIPLDARIVGIADAFDAMTSSRPYRAGMAIPRALSIIERNLGSQFDFALGQRFCSLGRAGLLDHIAGHSEPGIPLQVCPMCGPTIVVRRDHRDGDGIFCRHCGGEVTVDRRAERLTVHPTGRRGAPADLEPEPDYALIDELVSQAAARPPPRLLRSTIPFRHPSSIFSGAGRRRVEGRAYRSPLTFARPTTFPTGRFGWRNVASDTTRWRSAPNWHGTCSIVKTVCCCAAGTSSSPATRSTR